MFLFAAALVTLYQPEQNTILAAETISNVKISFETDGFDNQGMPILSAETDNSKYSAGSLMTLKEYEDTETGDTLDGNTSFNNPVNSEYRDYNEMVYVVELEASQGYRFSSDSKIKLSGAGAVCVENETKESKTILVVYVKFSDLNNMLGEIETASWKGEGRASWSQTQNAAKYELRLFYQGKMVGSKKVTGADSFDFSPLIKKKGSYRFSVRPVSASNQWGSFKESGEFMFSEEIETISLPAGWQQTLEGFWWYRERDGAYLQKNWLFVDGFWYFFDEKGYLQLDNYVKWGSQTYYVDQNGQMITTGKAPDGRLAESSGILKWPES
jgi:glucan-binding YG repeat protein